MERINIKKNKIAGYRVYLGLTQKEVANYLNISPQSYSNKENKHRSFTDREKIKMKILFQQVDSNLTIDKIFF